MWLKVSILLSIFFLNSAIANDHPSAVHNKRCGLKLYPERYHRGDFVRTLYNSKSGIVGDEIKSIRIFGDCSWEMKSGGRRVLTIKPELEYHKFGRHMRPPYEFVKKTAHWILA